MNLNFYADLNYLLTNLYYFQILPQGNLYLMKSYSLVKLNFFSQLVSVTANNWVGVNKKKRKNINFFIFLIKI